MLFSILKARFVTSHPVGYSQENYNSQRKGGREIKFDSVTVQASACTEYRSLPCSTSPGRMILARRWLLGWTVAAQTCRKSICFVSSTPKPVIYPELFKQDSFHCNVCTSIVLSSAQSEPERLEASPKILFFSKWTLKHFEPNWWL